MISRPVRVPQSTRCPECGRRAAEAICALCKTPRPQFEALKRIAAAPKPAPKRPCRYFPKDECTCGSIGGCLAAA